LRNEIKKRELFVIYLEPKLLLKIRKKHFSRYSRFFKNWKKNVIKRFFSELLRNKIKKRELFVIKLEQILLCEMRKKHFCRYFRFLKNWNIFLYQMIFLRIFEK